jgi:integrase/recombinase XerC
VAQQVGPLLLDEAIAEFLTTLRAGKPSPHTIRGYASDLAGIRALLDPDPATLTIEDLSVSRLRAGFAAFADTHARASVLRAWAVWNRFFAHLLAAGVITGNPMGGVPKPKAASGAPSAFTDTDLGTLISTLRTGGIPARRPWPTRDYAIITTLALTGLRRAELLDLAVDDVEGSPGERQLAVRHGKGDKYRAIPIQPVLEHLIETYLQERWVRFPIKGRPSATDPWSAPARTALWVGDQGRAMTTSQLGHLVQRAYRAAGINSRRPAGALVHALRHTFATTLLEHGTTAAELQDLLGHASLATTSRYLKTRPEHLRSAIAANPVYGQIEN